MAYVSVPKDLTRVKNKIAFNLTRRQIICFAAAAAMGLPFYFFTRGVIGNSNAVMGMVLLMIPAFLFAMYERDGMPLEKILMNMVTVRFLRPHLRLYETENLYEKEKTRPVSGTPAKRRRKKKRNGSRRKRSAAGGRNLGVNMDRKEPRDRMRAHLPAGEGSTQLDRRNGNAGFYAAAQRGGRNHARQG